LPTGESASIASGIQVEKNINSKKNHGFIENKVYQAEFEQALEEIRPAFGMDNSGLENRVVGGFYNYGHNFEELYQRCKDFIGEIRHSKNT